MSVLYLLRLLIRVATIILLSSISVHSVYGTSLEELPSSGEEGAQKIKHEFVLNKENIINSLKITFEQKIKNNEYKEIDVFLFSNIRFSKQREYLHALKILPLDEKEKQKKYIKDAIIKPLQKRFLDLLEKNLVSFELVQLFGMNLFVEQRKYITALNLIADDEIFENQKRKVFFENKEKREEYITTFVTRSLQSTVTQELADGHLTEKSLKVFDLIALPKQASYYDNIKENPFLKIPFDDLKLSKKNEIIAQREMLELRMKGVRNSLKECVELGFKKGKITDSDLELFQNIRFDEHHKYYPTLLEGTLKQHKCLKVEYDNFIQHFDSSLLPFIRFGLNTGIFVLEDLEAVNGSTLAEQSLMYQNLFKKKFLNLLCISEEIFAYQAATAKSVAASTIVIIPTDLTPILSIPINPAINVKTLGATEKITQDEKFPNSNQRKKRRQKKKKIEGEIRREEQGQKSLGEDQKPIDPENQASIIPQILPFVQSPVVVPKRLLTLTEVTISTIPITSQQLREDNFKSSLDQRIKQKDQHNRILLDKVQNENNVYFPQPKSTFDNLALRVIFNLTSGPLKVDFEIEEGTWDVSRSQMGNYFEAMWCKFDKSQGKGGHYKVFLPKSCTVISNGKSLQSVENEWGGSLTLPQWEQSFKDGKPLPYLRRNILGGREKLRNFYVKVNNACKVAEININDEKKKIDLDLLY